MKLNIHIGHVVMHGGQRLDSESLAEAIRLEIGRSIAQGGLPSQLQSSSMRPEGKASPVEAGAVEGNGIGGAIYRSFNV